jgi:hypothetical protein
MEVQQFPTEISKNLIMAISSKHAVRESFKFQSEF